MGRGLVLQLAGLAWCTELEAFDIAERVFSHHINAAITHHGLLGILVLCAAHSTCWYFI